MTTNRSKVAARWLGWLEIAAAPALVGWATAYHLRDDSGMAAMMWLYSFLAAAIFFGLPGCLLLTTRRAGWVAQVLVALFLLWLIVSQLMTAP